MNEVLRVGMRLALISAPAGFGKTSLLAEWASQSGAPTAWLALDTGDNDPVVFLTYVAAALERARAGALPVTIPLLSAASGGGEAPPLQTILSALVNDLSALPEGSKPLVLAMDDFQFVSEPQVREAVRFLVENLPPGLRIAIATRSDPPLALARLRARGQMVELRAADLRFTPEEAAEFLLNVMRVRLEPHARQEMVAALTARTEGWIAGLQMAALALLSEEGDSSAFIRSFSGSHRYILDYLAEEVLARQPAEVVDFLLRTCLLTRFNAGLCAAVGGKQSDDNQQMLESLDRSNLFLVPLDAERQWYRYHHLFADLLQAQLKQTHPEWIADLHRKASKWFESNGYISEAIHHSLAGGEHGQATRLVETHTVALFRRGELHAVLRWVSMLPPEISARRPWLCIYRAWAVCFSGELHHIEPLLQQAETHISELNGAEQRELEGNCAAIRCYAALTSNQIGPLSLHARQAKEKLPESAGWARSVVDWIIGYTFRLQGELERSAAIFERNIQLGLEEGDPWGTAMAATDLGIVRRIQGRLNEAVHIYTSELEFLEQRGARRLGYVGRLLTGLASVLYIQNDLQGARRLLEEAVERNRLWRNPNHLVFSYLNLSRVLAAQEKYQEAAETITHAETTLQDLPVLAILKQSLEGARLSLGLLEGNVPSGVAVEEMIQAGLIETAQAAIGFDEIREARMLLLARVLIAQQRGQEALQLLQPLEDSARTGGRGSTLIEVLTLKAVAAHLINAREESLAALEEAVTRAEPENAVRLILDTAPLVPGALAALLQSVIHKFAAARRYAQHLLALLPQDTTLAPAEPKAGSSLIEPITSREMEVLRLIANGLTNAQIAERLVISMGTVKAHSASIFRKLDAANRTQAVSRARELGILDK
jgi:LuxR family transcriptional regulator, maltose regulon positive regulatory protein